MSVSFVPFTLSGLLQSVTPGRVIANAHHFFGGARLFRGSDQRGAVYLADLSPTPPAASIGIGGLTDHYFLSQDGRLFHQLCAMQKENGATITDTPGLISIFIAWSHEDAGAALSYDIPNYKDWNGQPALRAITMPMERIPPADILRNGVFHYYR